MTQVEREEPAEMILERLLGIYMRLRPRLEFPGGYERQREIGEISFGVDRKHGGPTLCDLFDESDAEPRLSRTRSPKNNSVRQEILWREDNRSRQLIDSKGHRFSPISIPSGDRIV